MHALSIFIVWAMRVVFVLALENPNGLVQVSVGDGRYYFSPNQLTAPNGTRVRFYFYGVSSSLHGRVDQKVCK